jgi:DNA-directed RNA polymerase subunit RPC12/RpoP
MEARKRPRRNWIQEERRKTLGDWVGFCVDCGFTLRYFVELEGEIPRACPGCHGEVRYLCVECGARFPSAFLVECEECGAPVRPNELFGGPIRKAGK